jgi:hypothetical protein
MVNTLVDGYILQLFNEHCGVSVFKDLEEGFHRLLEVST